MSGVEESSKSNPKAFWNYFNYLHKDSSIPAVMHLGSRTAVGSRDVAELFAEHFSSVYDPPFAPGSSEEFSGSSFSMGAIHINQETIVGVLTALDATKGMGPDGIPPGLLKCCAASVSVPLFHLFNRSLSSGIVPRKWKVSFVTPIPKKGNRSKVEDYRPVCSLSVIPKVLEKIIVSRISPCISGYLTEHQHGFRAGKSVVTNLLGLQQVCLEAFSWGHQVDCIYTDFSKCFDKVPHSILLRKMKAFGFFGSLLQWFSSYLSDRFQIVRIKTDYSSPFPNTSGVPQGSHIGPLCFLIFVNDVASLFPEDIHFSLFADDLKLFSIIRGSSDSVALQLAVNSFYDWCCANNLYLNLDKCSTITYSRSNMPITHNYSIDGRDLSRVTTIKDLGIIFDTRLTFSDHIDAMCSRAMRALGFLKRHTRDFRDVAALVALYNSLVRSILDYGSIVWSPFYVEAAERIERVQRKFLRYISFKKRVPWAEFDCNRMLRECSLWPLKTRRRSSDVVFLYKLLRGDVDCPRLLNLICLHTPSHSTRSINPFYVPTTTTNYLFNNPIHRAQRAVNSLCSNFDFDPHFHNLLTLKRLMLKYSD